MTGAAAAAAPVFFVLLGAIERVEGVDGVMWRRRTVTTTTTKPFFTLREAKLVYRYNWGIVCEVVLLATNMFNKINLYIKRKIPFFTLREAKLVVCDRR